MSELSLEESLAIVKDQFLKVLWQGRRRKHQHLDRVGIAVMDLILNSEKRIQEQEKQK